MPDRRGRLQAADFAGVHLLKRLARVPEQLLAELRLPSQTPAGGHHAIAA